MAGGRGQPAFAVGVACGSDEPLDGAGDRAGRRAGAGRGPRGCAVPGSRNAPLSFALHDADRAGRLRLHVRIDERTAGFLALGLAKASGLPVPVVTTSGTAAVNLHPAVVEADYSRVRLVVLTADRPVEMRGTGANQTIDQVEPVRRLGALVPRACPPTRGRRWPAGAALVDRAPRRRGRPGRCTSTSRSASRWCRTATRPGRSRWTPRPTAPTEVATGTGATPTAYAGGRDRRRGRRPGARRRPRARRGGRLAAARRAVVGHRAGPNALAAYRLLLDAPRRRASSGWSWPGGRPCPAR